MHSSKAITGSSGSRLSGKKICLCVTGSVAAARSVDLARELMRNGAEVHCVMSESAGRLIGAELLHWATGNPVAIRLTGDCEHVTLCGETSEKCDLLLVAPCTANTLGKIARGIDDTPVTTFASTALGAKIPAILVPAMHESIYNNPFVSKNIESLRASGVRVMNPRIESGKAKIPETGAILLECMRAISKKTLAGKRVLVTAGATREFLDEIRFISNPGTGKMGLALAREAYILGAEVTLIAGHMEARVPPQISLVRAGTVQEMFDEVRKSAPTSDFILLAASVGDFIPEKRLKGKAASKRALEIRLIPAPKISDSAKKWSPHASLLVFKAEAGVTDAELARRARQKMSACRADAAVANDVSREGAGFAVDTNQVLFIKKSGKPVKISGTKERVAEKLLANLIS